MNPDFAKALVKAQQELPAIEKDGRNPHFRSEFVTLDHLLAEVLPVLNRNGLGLAQFPTANDLGQPTLTTIIYHESGDTLSHSMPLFLSKQDPQGQGSAITYARRYAVAAALGISDEKDDDAEATRSTGGAGDAATPTRPRVSPSPGAPQPGAAASPVETPEQKKLRWEKAWDAQTAPKLVEAIAKFEDADELRMCLEIESERTVRTKGDKPRKSVLGAISARIRELEPDAPEVSEGDPSSGDAPTDDSLTSAGAQNTLVGESASPSEGFMPLAEPEANEPPSDVFGSANGTAPTLLRLKAALAFIQDQPASVGGEQKAKAWTKVNVLFALSEKYQVVAGSLEEVPETWIDNIYAAIPDDVRASVESYGPEALAAEAERAK